MTTGIINSTQNPFVRDSWVEQGYSCTIDRQEYLKKLLRYSVREIKDIKEENYGSYVAFVGIRWGFAYLSSNILLPTYKWNNRESYDIFGEPINGFKITESQANLENEFNKKIFEIYELAKQIDYPATRFLQKIRNDGGPKAAKYWLNPKRKDQPAQGGFVTLSKLKKLDISLEALVLRHPFLNLFTNEELEVARTRLIAGGYDGPELMNESPDHLIPEEISRPEKYIEGAKHTITVNAYERNQQARRKCIDYYGSSCVVCGFNFESRYGSEFIDFIHVHHLKPISLIGEQYILDPIGDLRPVCPNCHAAIHRKYPPFTIEQIKKLLSTGQ